MTTIEECLDRPEVPIIDVRSPKEYRQGHIPGAINIPIFDDQQRADIGTLYKHSGREAAVAAGLKFVGQKAKQLIRSIHELVPNPACFVHCWRGGMRSEGFAWLLKSCHKQPHRIQGGYKSFRRLAAAHFDRPRPLMILGGATGSGKTELLQMLNDAGQQVIDLERLANHRGSSFGGIGQPPQPTVEQFENNLFMQWQQLDPNQTVWLECESRSIGQVFIPQGVWKQMLAAPAVFVEVDAERRIDFLMEQYGKLPPDELADALRRISKRLDGPRFQAALQALERGRLREFAQVALDYYDKGYRRSLRKSPFDLTRTLQLKKSACPDSIPALIEMANRVSHVNNGSRIGEPNDQACLAESGNGLEMD